MSPEQMMQDIEFLARRALRAGSFSCDSKRDFGVSSNSLIGYAYDVAKPQMPSDRDDYAACVRAVRKLPRHRRTRKVMTALSIARQALMSDLAKMETINVSD